MKEKIRKRAIETRKKLDCSTLSEMIIKNLFSLKEYQESKGIICYYPLKYEADTKVCFSDSSKTWYLPRVNGDFLDICPYGELDYGSFGIKEPNTDCIKNLNIIDMVIIPACAVDRKGYRLGWGKGYYDRFLPSLDKKCHKVVLIYSPLIYETVFPEEYDIKADIIISDKEILRI